MRPALLRPLALACGLSVCAGCFGSFATVRRVHEFNGSITESGVVHTLVMYALVAFPVYSLSIYADVLLFNVIEFWTGNNPMLAEAPARADATVAVRSEVGQDGRVTMHKNGHALALVPQADGRLAMEVDGVCVGYARITEDGGLVTERLDGTPVRALSGEQVAALQAGLAGP